VKLGSATPHWHSCVRTYACHPVHWPPAPAPFHRSGWGMGVRGYEGFCINVPVYPLRGSLCSVVTSFRYLPSHPSAITHASAALYHIFHSSTSTHHTTTTIMGLLRKAAFIGAGVYIGKHLQYVLFRSPSSPPSPPCTANKHTARRRRTKKPPPSTNNSSSQTSRRDSSSMPRRDNSSTRHKGNRDSSASRPLMSRASRDMRHSRRRGSKTAIGRGIYPRGARLEMRSRGRGSE
jgi:hypothetical protein